MNYITEQKLKAQYDEFFNAFADIHKKEYVEAMYQAFKARMMLELKVSGGSNQGVVYGHLETRD